MNNSETSTKNAKEGFETLLALSRAPFHPHPQLVEATEFLRLVFFELQNFQYKKAHTLESFVLFLQENPQFKRHFQNCIRILFAECSCVNFLRDTGMPGDRGFVGDILAWLKNKIFPFSPDYKQIDFFWQMLREKNISFAWLKKVPSQIEETFFSEIALLENERRSLWRDLRWQVCDAMELLAAQVFTVANSSALGRLRGATSLPSTPFFEFKVAFQELMNTLRFSNNHGEEFFADQEKLLPLFKKLRDSLFRCKEDVQQIVSLFEESGASIDAISRVELLRIGLGRIEKMSMMLLLPVKKYSVLAFCAYLFELKQKEESISYLASRNFNVLSKKVVEHAGNTGEHYVANTKKETVKMFYTSFGAGVLTVATCFLKFEIGAFKAPPLADFILTGLNYSFSFTFLHFLGLTLATKQPSATASHLAHSLHLMEKAEGELNTEQEQTKFSESLLFLRIIRTQFTAVLGNLSAVIPAAFLFCFWLNFQTNEFVISPEKAIKTLENFSVTSPFLYFFAAFTGVILWFASFTTGWLQNWLVFNRVALHPFLKKNFTGIASSVVLGFLLALPAFLGSLIGFSWDVRHVTLGAGSVVFSLFTLWKEQIVVDFWSFAPMYKALFGVTVVGVLNVFVSFGCALFLALKALKLQGREMLKVFVSTGITLLKNPGVLFKV